jgi:hypothetical protein
VCTISHTVLCCCIRYSTALAFKQGASWASGLKTNLWLVCYARQQVQVKHPQKQQQRPACGVWGNAPAPAGACRLQHRRRAIGNQCCKTSLPALSCSPAPPLPPPLLFFCPAGAASATTGPPTPSGTMTQRAQAATLPLPGSLQEQPLHLYAAGAAAAPMAAAVAAAAQGRQSSSQRL